MATLNDLYDIGGQSPWLDNLKRSYLSSGRLAGMVEDGIRGVTSNPTILARAIEEGSDYDDQFAAEVGRGLSVEDAMWELIIRDITGALAVLAPLHSKSGGSDGFVSLEVSPVLAHDTAGTIAAAKSLHERIAEPNLLVKIPATAEGVPAIRAMTAAGKSINVTLIFSLERYSEVLEAYVGGLEELVASGGDPSAVASVGSFFVSRVDTEVDRRLEAVGTEAALALRGKAAVAQARLAYEMFLDRFGGARFEALAGRGARRQRPLWASTSTKNPAYPDLAYVDTLIGPDTVNTMPEQTIAAFVDHGTVARTVDSGIDEARRHLDGLAGVGVDIADVADRLEREGVDAFAKSFEELGERLQAKAVGLGIAKAPA
jgi:transaldolase